MSYDFTDSQSREFKAIIKSLWAVHDASPDSNQSFPHIRRIQTAQVLLRAIDFLNRLFHIGKNSKAISPSTRKKVSNLAKRLMQELTEITQGSVLVLREITHEDPDDTMTVDPRIGPYDEEIEFPLQTIFRLHRREIYRVIQHFQLIQRTIDDGKENVFLQSQCDIIVLLWGLLVQTLAVGTTAELACHNLQEVRKLLDA